MEEQKINPLYELEYLHIVVEDITEMIGSVYDDNYGFEDDDLYTQADKFRRMRPYLSSIFQLLFYENKHTKEIIDKLYVQKNKS